jgi:putative tricarboxylic transport membrane protein
MNPNKSKYGIIPIFFWIGLGFFVMFFSYKLGLGGLHNPGPGLMPFLLGCFLFLLSLCFLVTFLYKKMGWERVVKEEQGQINFGRLGLVLASLFVYPLLFETLGFLITTLLILIILFRGMNNRWYAVLIASVLTVLVSYFLFTYLGIRFPKGILKWM